MSSSEIGIALSSVTFRISWSATGIALPLCAWGGLLTCVTASSAGVTGCVGGPSMTVESAARALGTVISVSLTASPLVASAPGTVASVSATAGASGRVGASSTALPSSGGALGMVGVPAG